MANTNTRYPTEWDVRWFTKLDLMSGHYQGRIEEKDVRKTTYDIRFGSIEFLVMPFCLNNALDTFYTLMNRVFQPFLDKFVVVYSDGIVVYNQTLDKHVQHLRQAF